MSSGSAAVADVRAGTELGRRWMQAVNDRDAEALVELADPSITFYPARLLGNRTCYDGYAGLRQWIAELAASRYPLAERVTDIEATQRNGIVVFGQVLVHDRALAPFSLLLSVRDGRVVEAHGYLSDRATIQKLGYLVA